MNTIKTMSLILALIGIVTLSFTSCSDDDDDKTARPVVTLTEVGHHNSFEAHPGHDMHLEADILAEGVISRIDVEITQTGGGNYVIQEAFTSGKYVGVKNAELHEHIDIPADAPFGNYVVRLIVTDKLGQQTTVESPIKMVEGDGDDDDDDED